MNHTTLKASLLATAIAFATSAAPERSVGQTVEDATITAAVKTALLADTRTEGFDINVDTHAGKVTLSGGADTVADKDAATELASAVEGVVSVDNQLIVAAEGTELRTDANAATLSGEVRAATEDATDGVDEEGNNPSVTDMDGDGVDEVGPGPDAPVNDQVGAVDGDDDVVDSDADVLDDAWITSKVKTQLLADEAVNGLDIDVDTQGSVVTLNGTVETATAHEAALRIARATSGVKEVVDRLTVAAH